MITYLSIISSSIVLTYVLHNFFESMYERKYQSKITYLIPYIVYVSTSLAVGRFETPIINLVNTTIIMVINLFWLYDTKKKNVIINFIIFLTYIVMSDTITTLLFFLSENNNTLVTTTESSLYLISGITNALFLICTHNLIIQRIKHYPRTKLSIALNSYMIFLLIFEFTVISYLLSLDFYTLPLLLVSIGFTSVNMGIFHLCKFISKNALLEQQAQLLEQQKNMTVKYCGELQIRYNEAQKLLHDIKSHLKVVDDLEMYDENIKEAYSYNLIKSINEVEQQFRCSNKIINAIIWDKLQKCNQLNIEFNIDMQDLDFEFMNDLEITTLFANLLDNAIESCEASKESTKEISLRIHQFKDYIVLRLINTLGQTPIDKSGKLVSTKPGHLGLGMLILEELIEKYNGNLKCDYLENYFETKIILSLLK